LKHTVRCTAYPVYVTAAVFNGPADGRIRIPKQELVGTVQVLCVRSAEHRLSSTSAGTRQH